MPKIQARLKYSNGDYTYVDLDAASVGTNADGSTQYGLAAASGGGGGGDASAANQTAVQAVAGSDASKAVAVQGITSGKPIPVTDTRLPTALGQTTAANSLPVTLATDGTFATSFGTTTDSTASSDTGTFSFMSFVKRLLSKLTTGLPIHDGTQVANTIASDTGYNSLLVSGGRKEISIALTSGTASAWYDVSNYAELIIQISSLGTGPTSASLQWSNDNGTTVATTSAIQSHSAQNTYPSTSMVATTTYKAARYGRYFRLLTNATITSGTFSAIVECLANSSASLSVGSQIIGQGAHAAAVSGNPVRVAGRAVTSNYTGVTTGQTADFITTLVGSQIHKPFSIPEADWTYAAASGGITNSTTAVTLVSATAANRNYLTGFQLSATALGTATEVVIRDGANGTVIWRGSLTTAGIAPMSFVFQTPIKSSVNTLLEFATLTATVTGSVYINAQGYIAP